MATMQLPKEKALGGRLTFEFLAVKISPRLPPAYQARFLPAKVALT